MKMVNYVKNFNTLPLSTKRLLGLGVVVALFIALPLFIWAIVTQTFLYQKKAATGEPGVCVAINKTIVVTPYYENNGTCHDIQTAINAVTGSGYTILVRPGSYTPSGSIYVTGKANLTITGDPQLGNGAAHITFIPGGWGFKVEGSSGRIEWLTIDGGSSNGMISINNSSDFQLGYLNVNSNSSHTIDVQNSSNVNIYNSEVQSSAGAIEIHSSPYTSISNNKVHDSDNAITIYNSNGAVVMGNLMTQNRESGLQISDSDNANINHNTIINSALKGSTFPAVRLRSNITNLSFMNNIVAYNHGEGISYTGNGSFTRSVGHNDVWNNTGGNYVGFDDYTGINGNISADPKINFTNWLYPCLLLGSPAIYGNTNSYEYMGFAGYCGPMPSGSPTPRPSRSPTPTPQRLHVQEPNGGEILTRGQRYTIKWEGPGRSTYLIYLVNSLGEQSLIDGASASASFYNWTVNSPIMSRTALHKIKIVEARTTGALSDSSDNFFTIKTSVSPTPTPRVAGECQFCGGIAGIRCGAGLTCRMSRPNFPDQGGICVKTDGTSRCSSPTPTPSYCTDPFIINITPQAISGTPGDTKRYNISITNNHDATCGNYTTHLIADTPSNWQQQFGTQTFTLTPNQSVNTYLDITSPTSNYTLGEQPISFRISTEERGYMGQTQLLYNLVNPSPTPSPGPKIGDVNGDGHVNIVDIGIIIDNYRTSPPPNPAADLNGDGIVNIIDIGIVVDNYET